MNETESAAPPAPPCAIFLGDFNVGKSTLINALLRKDALHTSREESRALPTFVTRADRAEASFAAFSGNGLAIAPKTHEEFLAIRQEEPQGHRYLALGARLPATPFSRLVLVDTAGVSSDRAAAAPVTRLRDQQDALVVVVTDIEYWSAKHTMDLIAAHREIFGKSLMVVANKADHLNLSEVRRIADKAPQRMESYGICPAPPFFALSARLEAARTAPYNEYRHRTKRDVRERCDAGFDALRVALYEFESAHTAAEPLTLESLFDAPLPASLIAARQGFAA